MKREVGKMVFACAFVLALFLLGYWFCWSHGTKFMMNSPWYYFVVMFTCTICIAMMKWAEALAVAGTFLLWIPAAFMLINFRANPFVVLFVVSAIGIFGAAYASKKLIPAYDPRTDHSRWRAIFICIAAALILYLGGFAAIAYWAYQTFAKHG